MSSDVFNLGIEFTFDGKPTQEEVDHLTASIANLSKVTTGAGGDMDTTMSSLGASVSDLDNSLVEGAVSGIAEMFVSGFAAAATSADDLTDVMGSLASTMGSVGDVDELEAVPDVMKNLAKAAGDVESALLDSGDSSVFVAAAMGDFTAMMASVSAESDDSSSVLENLEDVLDSLEEELGDTAGSADVLREALGALSAAAASVWEGDAAELSKDVAAALGKIAESAKLNPVGFQYSSCCDPSSSNADTVESGSCCAGSKDFPAKKISKALG